MARTVCALGFFMAAGRSFGVHTAQSVPRVSVPDVQHACFRLLQTALDLTLT